MNQFVPLWTSILRSRKVAALPDDLYRTWTLCLATAQEHDHKHGSLPSVDDFSYALHMEAKSLMSRLSRLVTLRFLDHRDGIYYVHDWDDWRHKPDPTAGARKKAQREREREEKLKAQEDAEQNGHLEPDENVTDVTVTGVTSQNVTLSRHNTNTNITPTDTPLPPETLPHPDSPEEIRVCNLAAEIGGDLSWSLWALRRLQLGDTPEILEAALSEAVNAGKVSQPYVAKIATRLKRDGLPKVQSYGGFKVHHKPSEPTPPLVTLPADDSWKGPKARKEQA